MGKIMWTLPILLLAVTVLLSIPLSKYFSSVMEGRFFGLRWLRWFEARLDTGEQNWKQYTVSLIVFNTMLFIFGFVVLCLQPIAPLNPLHRGMLGPSTIFNTVISFMTNTNLQHYSGDQNLSNFSQIFFILPNMFLSASVGFCALTAIIRAFRGQKTLGNYFVDMWRVAVYIYLPAALIIGTIFMQQGMPMTYASQQTVTTLQAGSMGADSSGHANPQNIIVGPVAAVIPIKMLGTNGGGFYGMNSAAPLENPTAISNFVTTFAMMIFPFTLVLMYGRMLSRVRHSVVIYLVMLSMMAGLISWAVYFDTMQPNPAFTGTAVVRNYQIPSATAPGGKQTITLPSVASLPVDQRLGNLEGKEMRFGTSAGAVFAAITTDVTCGAVNAEHDSLNPTASISPFIGMWLNCVFGGKGVGMINFLLFLIIGVFLAGQMVGRSPEYLGRKVGAREVKLAVIALLVHPLLILGPSGLFAATPWGINAESNPGPHGLSQIVYQFSSSSANNGSAFDGLGVDYGFNNNTNPPAEAVPLDIATGLVMLFSRYLPIIAPIAMAFYLGRKKVAPVSLGTMRDDTATFGFLMLGTILVIGALLFLPVAALGPLAEHFGPIPFGG
jgi:potassium-transporting ATPase potassium-binding subunit